MRIAYPADSYPFTHHQLWALEAALRFDEGDTTHRWVRATACARRAGAVRLRERDGRARRYLVALARACSGRRQ